jgi:hypothetical protein
MLTLRAGLLLSVFALATTNSSSEEVRLQLVFRPAEEATGAHRLEAVRGDKLLKDDPIIVAPAQRIKVRFESPQAAPIIEQWTVTDVTRVKVKGGKNPRFEDRPFMHGPLIQVRIGQKVSVKLRFQNAAPKQAPFTPELTARGFDSAERPFRQRVELVEIAGTAQGMSRKRAESIPLSAPDATRESGPVRTLHKQNGDTLFLVIVELEETHGN